MSKLKLTILGIVLIIFVIPPILIAITMSQEEWDEIKAERESRPIAEKINIVKKEPTGELVFGNEWNDADELRELRDTSKITAEEECRIILNLIRDNINDTYLFEFWNQLLVEECR